MKTIKILLITFLMIFVNKAFGAYQLYADMDGVSLPYGTKLHMIMGHDLKSSAIVQGDMFEAHLANDIYVNNKLILPSKTVFRGRVTGVKYSKMLSRPASLYLTLDHLITKQGTQLPLNAGVSSVAEYVIKADGAVTTNGNYFKALKRDMVKSGGYVKKSVNWGKTKGDKMFNGAKYVLIPIGAIGGSFACAGTAVYSTVADLFRHGDEILIKKGDSFDIIILKKLEIPS